MTLGVTVASRFAEALLMRGRNRDISLAIVEGPSDSRFYRQLVNTSSTHILWLNGKAEALELAEKFRLARIRGVVTIVDADLDRYFGRPRQSPSVVWTSETDMEVMVLTSDAYLRVIPNLPRFDTLLKNRDRLFAAALPLAALRALSKQNSWDFDFKDLVFATFIDTAAITCDVEALCEEALRNNPHATLDLDTLTEKLKAFVATLSEPCLVYHGHDLCRILAMCTFRLFSGREVRFEQVSRKYELDDFKATSTWAELHTWQRDNSPFKIVTVPETPDAGALPSS